MRRSGCAVVVALVAVLLAACQDTRVARCNSVIAPQVLHANQLGAVVYCDPSYDEDEPADAKMVVQWNKFLSTGERSPYIWLWERRLSDVDLVFWARVGVCEVQAWRDGRVPAYYLDVQRYGVPGPVAQQCVNATPH